MKVPAMRTAMAIATIAVAALTAWAPGAAASPGSGSGGGQGPGPLEQIPPKPEGGDGEHEPGEPCKFGNEPGHYAWKYETHYGWGWQLMCLEN